MEFSITVFIIVCIVVAIISCIIKKCCNNNIIENNDINDRNIIYGQSQETNNANNHTNISSIRYYIRDNVYDSENINENNILNLSMQTYVNDINNNLSKLEIYKYSQIEELFDINVKNDNISCPICFEDYNNDDDIYNLKCNHIFHSKCLNNIALNALLI